MESVHCDLSLVVLASNADPDLGLFREMLDVYRDELDNQPRTYEVIVVDDGIGGEFFEAVLAIKETWPELRCIQFHRPFGESVALSVAVRHARGRFVITSGWYLQVDARGLKRAVELLEGGVDYVAMRREPRCDGLVARFQSWLFNAYTRWLTKVQLHDLNCSFRAFRREVVEELRFHGDLFRFISIMAVQQGFKVREIPLRHLREEGGPNILAPGQYIRRLLDIMALFFLMKFTKKPLRFFGMMGSLFFLAGAAITLWMGYLKFFHDVSLADKPLLVLGIFLTVLGMIIASIGLIGEVIIYTHGKDLRDYHIARVVEGTGASVIRREDPTELRVTLLNGTIEDQWRRYVEGHPSATLFHGLPWRDALLRTFPHHALYAMAMRGEKPVGVLPMVFIKSVFLGRCMVSVPFGVYGGILSDDAGATRALVEEAHRLADEFRAQYVELRHFNEPEGLELPATDLYCTFVRELPSDPGACVAELPRKARAEVRKARRNGDLAVDVDGIELEHFHHLFVVNKRKLGSPPFPLSLFYNLKDALGDRAMLLSVRHGERVVAAVMSFIHGDTMMPYYSGSLPESHALSANNLMYTALMEHAVERGLHRFDFGRSRKGTGSFAFKKNQGFEPRELHYSYLIRDGSPLPEVNAGSPRYEFARKVFRILPTFAAKKVGSYVAKRLPI